MVGRASHLWNATVGHEFCEFSFFHKTFIGEDSPIDKDVLYSTAQV